MEEKVYCPFDQKNMCTDWIDEELFSDGCSIRINGRVHEYVGHISSVPCVAKISMGSNMMSISIMPSINIEEDRKRVKSYLEELFKESEEIEMKLFSFHPSQITAFFYH